MKNICFFLVDSSALAKRNESNITGNEQNVLHLILLFLIKEELRETR